MSSPIRVSASVHVVPVSAPGSQEIATLKSRIVQFLIGPQSEWPKYAAMLAQNEKN
jgi:hypothetical protein